MSGLLTTFPAFKPANVKTSTVQKQFKLYQTIDTSSQEEKLNNGERADTCWLDLVKTNPELKELAGVMMNILVVPHSSAHCERVFSIVRKK